MNFPNTIAKRTQSANISKVSTPLNSSKEKRQSAQTKAIQNMFARAADYAAEYSIREYPNFHFFNTRLVRTADLLKDFQEGKVLDVGCGPAKIAQIFFDKEIYFFGIDVSKEMLLECKKKYSFQKNFDFNLSSMEEIPFRKNYFDVVLSLGSFEYADNPRAALCEVRRVLKPKGILIISMLNNHSLYRLWQSHIYDRINNMIRHIRTHSNKNEQYQNYEVKPKAIEHIYSRKFIINFLEKYGFEIDKCSYYDFRLLLPPLDRWMPSVALKVSEIFEYKAIKLLKYLGSGFIIKCHKK